MIEHMEGMKLYMIENLVPDHLKKRFGAKGLENLDIQGVFEKSQLSKEDKQVLGRSVEHLMRKQQPMLIGYFKSLFERAEYFADIYYRR